MCLTVNAKWRPCCRFSEFGDFSTDQYTFDEYRNSDWYRSIRQEMVDGWHPGCIKCKDEESRGNFSLRNTMNERKTTSVDSDEITMIEISLTNNCNLMCRMCGPVYSTAWNRLIKTSPDLLDWQHPAPDSGSSISEILDGIDLQKVIIFKYLGGEPFITPEIREIFEYLDDRGVIGDITFTTNTNCTFFPDKWLKYLSKFKQVVLELSIDGVGDLNSYIRHGSDWLDVRGVVDEWAKYNTATDNISVGVFTAVQALNLHDLSRIRSFALGRGLAPHSSLVMVPIHLSVTVLPKEYVDSIKDDVNFKFWPINTDNHDLYWDEFVKYNKVFDANLDIKLKDINPNLYSYMEKINDNT